MAFAPMEASKCDGRLVKHLDGTVWFCTTADDLDHNCPGYGFEHRAGAEPCYFAEDPCPVCGAAR
jgi:hypothetical protein